MADNRIAYGLAKKYGIDTTGMSPKEVWEALRKKGVTEKNIADGAYNSQEGRATVLARQLMEKRKREEEEAAKAKTAPKKPKLAIPGIAAERLYNELKSGKRYTYEQLLKLPVVQAFENRAKETERLAKEKSPISDKDKTKYGNRFLEGAKQTPKKFRADIVMGLPAAGKSSAVVNELKEKFGSFEFDNDEIKKLLPGYGEYGAAYVHNDSKAVQKYAMEAFKKGGSLSGANLAIPIIGSEISSVDDKWIKPLREAGYDIHVHHVEISNEESMNRMVARAIATGRYIPLHVIEGYGENPKKVYEQLKKEGRKGVTFE